MKILDSIDAIVPVYKQKRSIDFALGIFKDIYPNSNIHIYCDGGDDFSDISDKYAASYNHYEFNVGYPHTPERTFWDKERSLEFVKRIYESCVSLSNDLVILFEEDVLVRRRIKLYHDAVLYGYHRSNFVPYEIMDYVVENGGSNVMPDPNIIDWVENNYGAGGGCIFDRNVYMENYQKAYDLLDRDYDYLIETSGGSFGWPDMLITFVFMLGGYRTTGNYDVFEASTDIDSELLYNIMYNHGLNNDGTAIPNNIINIIDKSIIHKYKKYYK